MESNTSNPLCGAHWEWIFSLFHCLNRISYPWACVLSVDKWLAEQASSLSFALLHCWAAFRERMKSLEVTDWEKCYVCSCICSPSECLHRWGDIESQTRLCKEMKVFSSHKAMPGSAHNCKWRGFHQLRFRTLNGYSALTLKEWTCKTGRTDAL